MAEVRERLLRELRLAGVPPWSVQISTNIPLTSRGQAASGERQPADRGAAVYFEHQRQLLVSACDKWERVEDNLYSIALDVEAVRGRLRWGVVSIERALAGHQRLGGKSPILLGPGAPKDGGSGPGEGCGVSMRSRARPWFGTKGERAAPKCTALVRIEAPRPRFDWRLVFAHLKAQLLKQSLDKFRETYFT